MSKIFERLLAARSLGPDFLAPEYENLADPFVLPDMEPAVARIASAIADGEKIFIYGDYDVDGVTASALMAEALKLAGANPQNIKIMLPNRFIDGYGMSPKLIKSAQDSGSTLVITVDCGSRNHEIIDELNLLGIDTIVTDHHECPEPLPKALAIINPKRTDFTAPNGLDNLAGVGVAFKLAQALVAKGLIRADQEKWLLDLVLIGTICDSMTLTGENRILSFYGVKVLAKTRRPGLKELIRNAGVKNLTSASIGFQIGPRLNAAGRLQSANLSLDLVRETSAARAAALARQLEELNKKRKTAQLSAIREISTHDLTADPVIIEAGKWHEGILGIIAGRLVESHQKPAFVLAEVGDGIYKGSGRSFGDFNLAAALDFAKDSITNGGGHAAAAGVKLKSADLPAFREKINQYYRSLGLTDQARYLRHTADLDLIDFSELNLNLLQELSRLEPFGAGNEEPIFRLKGTDLLNVTRMGADQNHLRLDLKDKTGKTLKCLAFSAPRTWLNLDPQFDRIEPLVTFNENDFNGVRSLEARIADIDFLNS